MNIEMPAARAQRAHAWVSRNLAMFWKNDILKISPGEQEKGKENFETGDVLPTYTERGGMINSRSTQMEERGREVPSSDYY